MPWKNVVPEPIPMKPRHEFTLGILSVNVFQSAHGAEFCAFGNASAYGLLQGIKITDLETAKSTALRNYRDQLAEALRQFDEALGEHVAEPSNEALAS